MMKYGFDVTPSSAGTLAQMKRDIPMLKKDSRTLYSSTKYPPAALYDLCSKFRKGFGAFLDEHARNPDSERFSSDEFRFPKLSFKVNLKVDASILALRDEVGRLFQKTLSSFACVGPRHRSPLACRVSTRAGRRPSRSTRWWLGRCRRCCRKRTLWSSTPTLRLRPRA